MGTIFEKTTIIGGIINFKGFNVFLHPPPPTLKYFREDIRSI
jgi:hypothetical protein